MQVDVALMYMLPVVVDELTALVNTSAGLVEVYRLDPSMSQYVRTDRDDQYITQRYHVLPGSVQFSAVVMIMNDVSTMATLVDRQVVRQLGSLWDAIVELHGVREDVDARLEEIYIQPLRSVYESSANHVDDVYEFFSRALGNLGTNILTSTIEEPIVRWDDIFNGAGRERATRSPRTLGESINQIQTNRREHGGMVTRRQQEAAVARRERQTQAAQNTWVIDWNLVGFWDCPDSNGGIVRWPHEQMQPKHLWETICWLVSNSVSLYGQYNSRINRDAAPAMLAKKWLALQPAFRSLLQEAIRRQITFPTEVYRYLKDYVLGRDTTAIQVSMPWSDPAASYQTEELRSFMLEPVDVPTTIDPHAEFGREFRDIDLD